MNAFGALADDTRRRIVEVIASSGRLSAGDISARFSISKPAVSQHLKVLREAQLLKVEKRAQSRLYSIDSEGIDGVASWAMDMKSLWEARFDALDAYLQQLQQEQNKEVTARSPRSAQKGAKKTKAKGQRPTKGAPTKRAGRTRKKGS